MKYLRLTGAPDPAMAPEAFLVVADSEHATEARLLGWNAAPATRGGEPGDGEAPEPVTLLFDVDGDHEGLAEAMAAAPAAVQVDVAPTGSGRFYLLVDLSPAVQPMLREVLVEAMTRPGLVVLTPIVYREGEVHARLIGHSAAVQSAVDGLPDLVDVTVHEVGPGTTAPGTTTDALSDRQREAVRAALELGYYDQPRAATHEDVAAALGCAASTASEHLRKAEAKLVRSAMR